MTNDEQNRKNVAKELRSLLSQRSTLKATIAQAKARLGEIDSQLKELSKRERRKK